MAKYYKNLCNHQINVNLFGVGDVVIPANAKCVELEANVADVLNKMAYPEKVVEEVTPTFTVDDTPVVKAKKPAKKSAEEALVEEIEDVPEESKEEVKEETLEDITL